MYVIFLLILDFLKATRYIIRVGIIILKKVSKYQSMEVRKHEIMKTLFVLHYIYTYALIYN